MCIKPSSITKRPLQLFLIGRLMIEAWYVYQAFFNYKEAPAIISDRQTHDTNLVCVTSLLVLLLGDLMASATWLANPRGFWANVFKKMVIVL